MLTNWLVWMYSLNFCPIFQPNPDLFSTKMNHFPQPFSELIFLVSEDATLFNDGRWKHRWKEMTTIWDPVFEPNTNRTFWRAYTYIAFVWRGGDSLKSLKNNAEESCQCDENYSELIQKQNRCVIYIFCPQHAFLFLFPWRWYIENVQQQILLCWLFGYYWR